VFLPLAHGALGALDEVLLMVVIGGLAAVLAIVGFRSREQEETADKPGELNTGHPDNTVTSQPTQPASADHYRLD
jgi:hypothetical protein